MRTATLLYNPVAGRGRVSATTLSPVVTALRTQAVEANVIATRGPGTAAEQARDAAQSSEIVFACGGDGTVHEVLQGLALETRSTLGVLPFGSANVLARHLRLGFDPVRAAVEQVRRPAVRVPLGHITYAGNRGRESRFFASLAGAGADGLLAYRTLAAGKHRVGRLAYYLRAGQLFTRERFSAFQVEAVLRDGTVLQTLAVSAMCSRVDSLGGLFRPLLRRGSVMDAYLETTVIRPPSAYTLPAWFAMSWTGLSRWNRFQHRSAIRSVRCGEGLRAPVQVQADGEWLGQTPMHMQLVPEAVSLFCPPGLIPAT